MVSSNVIHVGDLLNHTDLTPDAQFQVRVPSTTDPSKAYIVTVNGSTEPLHCLCPAWQYQRSELARRSCKHTRVVQDVLELIWGEAAMTPAPTAEEWATGDFRLPIVLEDWDAPEGAHR